MHVLHRGGRVLGQLEAQLPAAVQPEAGAGLQDPIPTSDSSRSACQSSLELTQSSKLRVTELASKAEEPGTKAPVRRGTLSFCSSWLWGGVAPESTSGGSLETLRAHSISLNSVPSRHSSITMASVTFCTAQAHCG